jgi:cytochrome c-type biogenesis protein CcmF
MSDFGNFCLLLAFCLAVYAMLAAILGAMQKRLRFVHSAARAAMASCASIAMAFGSLLYLLLRDDFSVSHVANASSRDLPILYKIAAIWGAHDGSMLLWVFITALISGIVIRQNRFRHRDMMPYVTAVLMFNLVFFLLLNIFISNPFSQLVSVSADGSMQKYIPQDGQGLNPLLQYWAMVIHPPILYFGFIGFVVPFAFAIASLITGQPGDAWIRTTRRWTLWTWLLLGAGLMLGAKWAYVVLGWGGYWGWDPVENTALMPWLTGTAFLHSAVIQERRGMLKVWNILLVIVTFLLGIFGTFITRSGIVSSVHAFADSNLGKFFAGYMLFVLCASMFLIIHRLPLLKSEHALDSILSRESAVLFNNLVLVVACFAILWGTMFPVFSEWIRGKKITVGSPFFNSINVPIGLMLLFLTGVGPFFAWRKTSLTSLRQTFFWPSVLGLAACSGLLVGGMRNLYSIMALSLGAFVFATIIREFLKGAGVRGKNAGENFPLSLANLVLKNKRRYGGHIVHFGVVLIFIGIAGNAFNKQESRQLVAGQEMPIGSYILEMTDYREGNEGNYSYGKVVLQAYKNGKFITTLTPERREFEAGNQQTTTLVALHSTPKEDLYVIFTGASNDGAQFEIMAYVNPLVFWVWMGTVVLVLGTIVTLLPDQRGAVAASQAYFSKSAALEAIVKSK